MGITSCTREAATFYDEDEDAATFLDRVLRGIGDAIAFVSMCSLAAALPLSLGCLAVSALDVGTDAFGGDCMQICTVACSAVIWASALNQCSIS